MPAQKNGYLFYQKKTAPNLAYQNVTGLDLEMRKLGFELLGALISKMMLFLGNCSVLSVGQFALNNPFSFLTFNDICQKASFAVVETALVKSWSVPEPVTRALCPMGGTFRQKNNTFSGSV